MLSSSIVISAAKNDTDNTQGLKLQAAVTGTYDIYSNIVSSTNEASKMYCNIPQSWNYNNITKIPKQVTLEQIRQSQ